MLHRVLHLHMALVGLGVGCWKVALALTDLHVSRFVNQPFAYITNSAFNSRARAYHA